MVGKLLVVSLLLSGCAFTEMKDVYIDNSATNNFVGNPCGFYLGSHCVYIKARNPDNPYTK